MILLTMPNHAAYQNGKGDATNVLHKFDDSAIYESVAGDKWHEVNQYYSAREQWYILAEAYKSIADDIVDGLPGSLQPSHQGLYMASPVMFLYRHSLELHLKNILLDLREFENIETRDPSLQSHSLLRVWQSAKRLLSAINEVRLSEADRDASRAEYHALEERIKEFNDIDKSSMGYRYPVDRRGGRILAKLPTHSQLAHVKDIIGVMSSYFDGIETWIHEERNADLEMQGYWTWC